MPVLGTTLVAETNATILPVLSTVYVALEAQALRSSELSYISGVPSEFTGPV